MSNVIEWEVPDLSPEDRAKFAAHWNEAVRYVLEARGIPGKGFFITLEASHRLHEAGRQVRKALDSLPLGQRNRVSRQALALAREAVPADDAYRALWKGEIVQLHPLRSDSL